jgi:hypothetical protein
MFNFVLEMVLFTAMAISGSLALFFLGVGVFRQSKTMLKIGLLLALVPLLLYGIAAWYL